MGFPFTIFSPGLKVYVYIFSVGYKPFLYAIRGQVKTLAKIAEAAPPTLKLNTDLDSTTGSVEEGNLSPSAMSIRSDTETPHESPPHNSETPKQSECAVS